MRVVAAAGPEVGCSFDVSDVDPGVKLPESWCAPLVELRVEGKALETAFATLRLHAVVPLRVVDIHVERDGAAVGTDAIQRAAHVVHEEVTRARLLGEQHHARGNAIDVGQLRELLEADDGGVVWAEAGRIRVRTLCGS